MAYDHCSIEASRVLGRELTDKEAKQLEKELRKRARKLKQVDEGLSGDEAFQKAVDEIKKTKEVEAAIKARNRLLNLKRKTELMRYMKRIWNDDVVRGLEAILVGVNQAREGARFSVSAEQKQLTQSYLQGFMAEVKSKNLWREFASGALDEDVAEALFRMGPDANFDGLSKDAVKLAEIISSWQEYTRKHANDAGAFIGKLDGRVSIQTHDMFRLRKAARILGKEASADPKANRAAWKEYVLERIDREKTFEGVDNVDEFLESTYDALASGLHLKHMGEDIDKALSGHRGTTGFGARVSRDRVLHFKDAKSWMDYNSTFGSGSIRESVMFDLQRHGHNTGIMRVMGPNAEQTYESLVEYAKLLSKEQGLEGRSAVKDAADARHFDILWSHITGETNIPGNKMWARIANGARAIQSMSKLGGALLSSVADVALMASELKYQGVGFVDRWGAALSAIFRGRGTAEKAELLASLGILSDGLRASAARRFTAEDNFPGAMTSAMQTFFRWNGLSWWTDTMRAEAAIVMSNNMAFHAGKRMGDLGIDMRRSLDIFGIDEDMWDIVRTRFVDEFDGKKLIIPEKARDLEDDLIRGYLIKHADQKLLRKGKAKPSAREIREMRDEFERKLKSFFADRADYAVVEPDARIRAYMLGDNRPGTWMGEIRRMFWQFKAFPMAVLDKPVGREIFGRGDRSGKFWQAMFAGNGEWQGLVSMLGASMLFGYMAMSLKDISKGRQPRTPANGWDAGKIMAAALVQGGGAGIYGDFLFGEWRTRYGGGPIGSALGPMAGTIEDVMDLGGRAMNGDPVAAKAMRTALSNTPFANLFYVKAALDYSILYDLQEQLNPGYLRRMERRLQKENEQEFFFPPSQYAR